MSTVTHDRVLERIASFGVPLENVFIIAQDDDTHGVIAAWYPEIGLRSIIIDNDDLYYACHELLCAAGVRRFKSWEELGEAQKRENWEGSDTCADWRRHQRVAEEFPEEDPR